MELGFRAVELQAQFVKYFGGDIAIFKWATAAVGAGIAIWVEGNIVLALVAGAVVTMVIDMILGMMVSARRRGRGWFEPDRFAAWASKVIAFGLATVLLSMIAFLTVLAAGGGGEQAMTAVRAVLTAVASLVFLSEGASALRHTRDLGVSLPPCIDKWLADRVEQAGARLREQATELHRAGDTAEAVAHYADEAADRRDDVADQKAREDGDR